MSGDRIIARARCTATVGEVSPPPLRIRRTMKYAITQKMAMNRYPPIRCSDNMRELTLAALIRDQDSRTGHTLMPPRRTNARPSAILVYVVSIVCNPVVVTLKTGDRPA